MRRERKGDVMILVAGATGLVGGMITRSLLAQGQPVRILVRPGSNYQPLVEAGAQPILGDLKDRASLDAALVGVEVVITTANSAQRGGPDNPETVEMQGNRNLIDAAQAAGVKQFIFVSALGSDPNSPIPFVRGKGMTEQVLRHSGLAYTILAPTAFMDVWATMIVGMKVMSGLPITLVGEAKRRHSFIAARDVAAFAVAAVGHPAALNQYLPLGGPEALSWRDIVAVYERVLGRPLTVQFIAPGEIVPDLPPVPGLAEFMSGMLASQETFDSVVPMAEMAQAFGVQQTTLENFVRMQSVPVSA